jgi:hypothetical protein
VFLNMVGVVGGCEDFGFIDVVYTYRFEDLDMVSERIGGKEAQ